MTSEHERDPAGPCDMPWRGWSEYQRARERFLSDRAAESRAWSAARAAAERAPQGDAPPAAVAVATTGLS